MLSPQAADGAEDEDEDDDEDEDEDAEQDGEELDPNDVGDGDSEEPGTLVTGSSRDVGGWLPSRSHNPRLYELAAASLVLAGDDEHARLVRVVCAISYADPEKPTDEEREWTAASIKYSQETSDTCDAYSAKFIAPAPGRAPASSSSASSSSLAPAHAHAPLSASQRARARVLLRRLFDHRVAISLVELGSLFDVIDGGGDVVADSFAVCTGGRFILPLRRNAESPALAKSMVPALVELLAMHARGPAIRVDLCLRSLPAGAMDRRNGGGADHHAEMAAMGTILVSLRPALLVEVGYHNAVALRSAIPPASRTLVAVAGVEQPPAAMYAVATGGLRTVVAHVLHPTALIVGRSGKDVAGCAARDADNAMAKAAAALGRAQPPAAMTHFVAVTSEGMSAGAKAGKPCDIHAAKVLRAMEVRTGEMVASELLPAWLATDVNTHLAGKPLASANVGSQRKRRAASSYVELWLSMQAQKSSALAASAKADQRAGKPLTRDQLQGAGRPRTRR